jgi:carbon monoxide dehydrogenase subunit G
MDFEEVAGCVPGAQVLNKLSEDAYQVGMKIKLGPVTMQYKGQMEVVERDEQAYRAVLKGSAKEARGQGTAQATAHLQLVEDGANTRGTVHADVALSGRAAAMGQGVIGSVTDSMMGQFATNLQTMLTGSGAPSAVPDAEEVAAAAPSAAATQVASNGTATSGAATAPPRPAVTPPAVAAESSLDAAALAKSVVMGQLREPSRVLQVLAVAAVIAYRLGLRSGRRERARYLG